MRWTIAQMADVLVARKGTGLDPLARLAGVSIDSRTIRSGEPVRTKQTLGYSCKANSLRRLCGGRLHRWLTFWWRGRERDSTPWPGWPASRLILEPFEAANCSLPSTDRVTMDTIMWPVLSNAARWRLWRSEGKV